MRPAGGIQHRPRGIESAGEVYQEAHEFAVLILLGFVERTPADQRGVVAIALEFFQPFGQEIAPRFRARDVQPPVGLFTPYEVAQPVAMVEEALFKDLFVQARAVEAHVHGKADITLQRRVAGRGVDAVGIEALIQHQPLEHGFAVEQQLAASESDGAHAEIALHRVLAQGEGEVV